MTAATDERTVWILGSGFSRALGAPLLNDLLRKEELGRLRSQIGFNEQDMAFISHAAAALAKGLPKEGASGLWPHAEQFLEVLETACLSGSPLEPWLRAFTGNIHPPAALRDGAIRCIAAQCEAFLRLSNPASERVDPYRRWKAKLLSPHSTIVTFNYDLVVEQLDEWVSENKIFVPAPQDLTGAGIQYLKLHGSIAWRIDHQGRPGSLGPKYVVRDGLDLMVRIPAIVITEIAAS